MSTVRNHGDNAERQAGPGLLERNSALVQGLNALAKLRQFPGAAREFWQEFVGCTARIVSSEVMVLLVRDTRQEPARWLKIGEALADKASRARGPFIASLEQIADRCITQGTFLDVLAEGVKRDSRAYTLAVRLKLNGPEEVILAGLLVDIDDAQAIEAFVRLELAADTPELYEINLNARRAGTDVEKFATVLDLMVPVNAEKHFIAGALALCNELASRFQCDRVSLGWVEGGFVRLRAISRTEKFDRQMVAVQSLEMAMEECRDQDDEIAVPPPANCTVITRDHEKFALDQRAGFICSLPLRFEEEVVGVITCERREKEFAPLELQQIRLVGDQVAQRLADLKERDRWFGARWAAGARKRLATLFGPEHTWAKLITILVVLAILALFFIKAPYRVEGNFILRSDESAYLTAPFEGYIDKVLVRTGDHVAKGATVATLDTSELRLDEASAVADLVRYQREADKARASRSLGDMKISEALAEQAKAKVDIIRYRIEESTIRSPFDGVIVEGDLRERIGSPVKQGDALFRFARTDTLYAEAEINERDIKQILASQTGEISFVSQPKLKYPVRVATIESAAVPKKDANVFLVRLAMQQGVQPWWRPGMTGICKVNVDARSLIWILTHRTIDFLRLRLWW